jgi:hypothetical protein
VSVSTDSSISIDFRMLVRLDLRPARNRAGDGWNALLMQSDFADRLRNAISN